MNSFNFKTCQQTTGTMQMGRPVLCGRHIASDSQCCEHHRQLHEYNDQYWALHQNSAPAQQPHLR